MVRFLLEAGADQEHKTDEMHTALMEASMDGHVEVARLLLDSGAQVSSISIMDFIFFDSLGSLINHVDNIWTYIPSPSSYLDISNH